MDDFTIACADEDAPRARLALLLQHFSELSDEREPGRIMYRLDEVLLLVTCATIASCDDVVEVVAGGDGGAGHQQQDFIEPVHDPARLPFVRKLGKMLQKQRQTRSGRILTRTCDRGVIHGRAPAESERLRNHAAPSMQNHRSRAVNLTSEPCEAAAGARNCAAFTLYQQCQGRRMQSEKEQVALSSIAASAVLTIAKT